MRLSAVFTIAATFLLAALLSLVAARFSVTVIEDGSREAVRTTLIREGLDWARVDADGLQVFLAGTAPSEASRFKALSVAGRIVDAARMIDQMLVEDSGNIAPPRFSVEILRNDQGISLIGLIPAATDRAALRADIADVAGEAKVVDLLETADYPPPESWGEALAFAVASLEKLPRSKVSVGAERVVITAMADSPAGKRSLKTELAADAPAGVSLALDISAPRPVIAPFTLRFLIEDGEARFDACSADTEAARATILEAAAEAGLAGGAACTIGLGVPSPKWARAASAAIAALAELGSGSVTITDADVSLVAARGTPQARFDTVVGELETALPELFALHAVLPEPPEEEAGEVPEFLATLSPEGLVQIRGRVSSARLRKTATTFARARFASDAVHMAARVAEDLPQDWPLRVLAGLESLSYLAHGAVTVTPDMVSVSGDTGHKGTGSMIAGYLSEKLGEGALFAIDVTYEEALDPVASLPTPEECAAQIKSILAETKINFEPGSARIDQDGANVIDGIAAVLKECGQIRMEIAGHTDSQGRESMNQQLSQSRARAVLNALRERRVLTSSFRAVGYGESQPIADNDTEAGREANRRIEFRLIRPEEVAAAEEGTEAAEAAAAAETGDAAQDGSDAGAAAETGAKAPPESPEDNPQEDADASGPAQDDTEDEQN